MKVSMSYLCLMTPVKSQLPLLVKLIPNITQPQTNNYCVKKVNMHFKPVFTFVLPVSDGV